MGIINLTPDSFFDKNKHTNIDLALDHAKQMIDDGVDIIDIGGESTRPGAQPISLDEELTRVIPFIEKLRKHNQDICISIDTYKPEVMRQAIHSSANMINDIYALQKSNALQTAKELNVPVVLIHMQNNPTTMQINPNYSNDITDDINDFFTHRITACLNTGIERLNLILDPGFGFGKTIKHNLSLLLDLIKFKKHNLPILLGVSRKSTLASILNKKTEDLLAGSLTMETFAIMQGASILRVHDVSETKDTIAILNAINSRSEINE
ncbi:MAG: dihydropteroate synthase [Legionellales bacterium RIFCSPHIGHO2_12_FULL_35_11]|nr:MAG: dihydropteroate synthase [Legionellales bacterium RIFCSPHIGHO2_12_FULL_35_11]